ncbi:LOW QUALITY PROTEIN: ras association domain-containing protein 3-like [Erethizon dorsatum]
MRLTRHSQQTLLRGLRGPNGEPTDASPIVWMVPTLLRERRILLVVKADRPDHKSPTKGASNTKKIYPVLPGDPDDDFSPPYVGDHWDLPRPPLLPPKEAAPSQLPAISPDSTAPSLPPLTTPPLTPPSSQEPPTPSPGTAERAQKYNLAVTDKLKMTLNSNGIYTGFIKVQMELCKPPQTSPDSNGCINMFHISSTLSTPRYSHTQKKFLMMESPAKFALYKCCHRENQVYACKLSDQEHPLYLRLVTGPRTNTLSFVLWEHKIGKKAFSLPELQNFLRILDKEEDKQLQNLKSCYTAYRHKLEKVLGKVWKPS